MGPFFLVVRLSTMLNCMRSTPFDYIVHCAYCQPSFAWSNSVLGVRRQDELRSGGCVAGFRATMHRTAQGGKHQTQRQPVGASPPSRRGDLLKAQTQTSSIDLLW